MALEGTDELLVNRSGTTYTLEQQNLMAEIQGNDLLLVNRSDTTYKVTGQELIDSVVPDLQLIITFIPNVPYIDEVITVVPNTSGGVEPEGGYVFTYQWSISDDIEGSVNLNNILGANSNTYTPSEAQQGKFLGCTVQTTDARGTIANATGRTGPIDFKPATDPPVINSVVLTQDAVNDKRFSDNSFTTTVDASNRPNQLAMEAQVVGALSIAVGTDVITSEDTDGKESLALVLASDVNLGDGRFEVGDQVKANTSYTPETAEIINVGVGPTYSDYFGPSSQFGTRNGVAAFDGDLTTFSYTNTGVATGTNPNDYYLDFTPIGGITVQSKLEVYTQFGRENINEYFKVNGGGPTYQSSANTVFYWFDLTSQLDFSSGSATLNRLDMGGTKISSYSGTQVGRIAAIRVDGQILTDGNGILTLLNNKDLNKFQPGDVVQYGSDATLVDNFLTEPIFTTPLIGALNGTYALANAFNGRYDNFALPQLNSWWIWDMPNIAVNQYIQFSHDLGSTGSTVYMIINGRTLGELGGQKDGDNITRFTKEQWNAFGFTTFNRLEIAYFGGNNYCALGGVEIDGKLLTDIEYAGAIQVLETDVAAATITVDGGNWDTSNQSYVWSSLTEFTQGTENPSYPVQHLYDGNLGTYTYLFSADAGIVQTDFTSLPGGGIPVNSTIEVYVQSASNPGYAIANNGSQTVESTSTGWQSIPNPPALLTNLTFVVNTADANSWNPSAVRIDGKILVDAVNDSQVWSDSYDVIAPSTFEGDETNLFDGILTSGIHLGPEEYGTKQSRLSLPVSIPCTELEVYISECGPKARGDIYVNGGEVQSRSSIGWNALTPPDTGVLTTLDLNIFAAGSDPAETFFKYTAIKVNGVVLLNKGIRNFGDTLVTTVSPKKGEGTISAINSNVVTLDPFVDNCFVEDQYLIHASPKPIRITPKTEAITNQDVETNVLTFAGNDELIEFANGDPVTMCNADGKTASYLAETSTIATVSDTVINSNPIIQLVGGATSFFNDDTPDKMFNGITNDGCTVQSNGEDGWGMLVTFSPPLVGEVTVGANQGGAEKFISVNGEPNITLPQANPGGWFPQELGTFTEENPLRTLRTSGNVNSTQVFGFSYVRVDDVILLYDVVDESPIIGSTLTFETPNPDLQYFKADDVVSQEISTINVGTIGIEATGEASNLLTVFQSGTTNDTYFTSGSNTSPNKLVIKTQVPLLKGQVFTARVGIDDGTLNGQPNLDAIGNVRINGTNYQMTGQIIGNGSSNPCSPASTLSITVPENGDWEQFFVTGLASNVRIQLCEFKIDGSKVLNNQNLASATEVHAVSVDVLNNQMVVDGGKWDTSNQSQVWSSLVSNPGGTLTGDVSNGFNGKLAAPYATYFGGAFPANCAQLDIPILSTDKVIAIVQSDPASFLVDAGNGTQTFAQTSGPNTRIDISSAFTSDVTSWKMGSTGNWNFSGLEINGKILVDAVNDSEVWSGNFVETDIVNPERGFNGNISQGCQRAEVGSYVKWEAPNTLSGDIVVYQTVTSGAASSIVCELLAADNNTVLYTNTNTSVTNDGTIYQHLFTSTTNVKYVKVREIGGASFSNFNGLRVAGKLLVDTGARDLGETDVVKQVSGTGVVNSVNLENNTMTLTSSNDEWVTGYYVSTPEKNAVEMRGYLSFDSQGNNVDLERLPQSPVLMDDKKTPKLNFPSTFSTGEGVDTDLPFPTYLETYVQASNDLGSSNRVKSNELFPNWTGRPYIAPGSYRVMQDEFADWCYWACSSDYRSAIKTIQDAEETVQQLRTKADNLAADFLNRDDVY